MLRKVRKALGVVLLASGLSAAMADDDERLYIEYLQELFRTTTVYPQERGEVQVTLAADFHRDGEEKRFEFSPELEYGVTDQWQVGIQWAAFVLRNPDHGRSTRGAGDFELSTQYSFMNIGGTQWHVATGFELGLPVGSVSRGLGEGVMEYTPYAVIARDFPEFHYIQTFAQAGVSFMDAVRGEVEDEDTAHTLGVSFGLLYPTRTAVFSTEVSWDYNKWDRDGDENHWVITPGVTFGVGLDYEIGIGLPIGLSSPADRIGVIALFSRSF
jgi:hypothetical protein